MTFAKYMSMSIQRHKLNTIHVMGPSPQFCIPTKFHCNHASGSGEDFLKMFSIYGHGGLQDHVTQNHLK